MQSGFDQYWCHSCQQSFSLETRSGVFQCNRCRSELIEAVTSGADDPRTFTPHRENPTTRIQFFPFGRPNSALDRSAFFQMIFGPIQRPAQLAASPSQIENLPSVQVADIPEEAKECAICIEDMTRGGGIKRMPCNHCFHESCLRSWLVVRNCCPVCRARIQGGS